MLYKFLTALSFICFFQKDVSPQEVHPFHASIAEIEYNPANKTLEIGLKLFSDDIDTWFEKKKKQTLAIGTEKQAANAEELLKSWVFENFSIKVNDKPLGLNFIGKELDKDNDFVVWVFFEADNIESLNSIEVINRLMTDIFNDQQNIVYIKNKGERKTLLLDSRTTAGIINF